MTNSNRYHEQWFPHVTVASISIHEGKYLMVQEKSNGHSVINQPAGHIEQGETLIDAVIRETLEETGWKVKPQYLVGIYQYIGTNNQTYLRFTFHTELLERVHNSELDPAIEDVLWINKSDITQAILPARSPAVIQCIEDFENGNQLPLAILQQLKYPS